jgi:hypothetical protein
MWHRTYKIGTVLHRSFLQSYLHYAVREKNPQLVEKVLILHDNATAHSAYTVKNAGRWGECATLSLFLQPQSMSLRPDSKTAAAIA